MTSTSTAQEAGVSVPPPREDLFRALNEAPTLVRSAGSEMPTLTGHFAVFDQWTEIDSVYEGRFLERLAPTSMDKTIAESRNQMRVLFQHGKDPQIGDKVLGPITELTADATGARYSVPLLDTSYNRDLIPGLEAGLYGASFRFQVIREDFNSKPKKSKYNPMGLPERTVTEARVREFGPVTFPAYAGATAGLRSITDRIRLEALVGDPDKLRELIREVRMDTQDLSTLAQMIMCGTQYIDDQDEPGDEANIPKMQAILASLAELVPVEAQDAEPPEGMSPPGDQMSSEPEPSGVTTRHSEPEPSAATTRAKPARAGLYPYREEAPSWRL